MQLIELISSIKNSVVAIGILQPPTDRVNIIGSGFFVKSDGLILSAAHLFKNLGTDVISHLAAMVAEKEEGALTRYKWLPLEIVARNDAEDAALLKIQSPHDTLLKPLKLGVTTEIKEGQEIFFTGFPYAANLMNEGFGVTLITNKGIISSVKRKATPPQPIDWFIIDAISNPGNSGCPLIDIISNTVIGIMSISFRTGSKVQPSLDIREPMHIAGAKPIDYAKALLD
ncbi:MAG: serine protease [Patescibacteria group bacterium]|jgi:S1-C subfamily serine protease